MHYFSLKQNDYQGTFYPLTKKCNGYIFTMQVYQLKPSQTLTALDLGKMI